MKATERIGHHRSALHNQNATVRHDALASQIDSPSATEGLSEKFSTAPEPSLNPKKRRARVEALFPVSLKCLAAVIKLDEGLLVALLQEASLCTLKQKEVVPQAGENDDRIHMVVDGVVTLHTYTENDRQFIRRATWHFWTVLAVSLAPCSSWPMDLLRSLLQTACRFAWPTKKVT